MIRREFITLLGGAAAAWPVAARAEQPQRMRRIGVLGSLPETDAEGQARISALRKGLQDLGWTEGRNIQIDYRATAGDPARTHAFAAELGGTETRCDRRRRRFGIAVCIAAGDAHHTDRIHADTRSSRKRLRCEPGATGGQPDRIQYVRCHDRGEMAGAAQADCTRHSASKSHRHWRS